MGFDPGRMREDLAKILPELVLIFYACFLLALTALMPKDKQRQIGYLALLAVLLTLTVVVYFGVHLGGAATTPAFMGDFALDTFSIWFKTIFLASGALTIMLSIRYLDLEKAQAGEYYTLLLFAIAAMMFMASATNFILIYVALETMALSIYVLAGFLKDNRASNEAALKYFILGAFSSAIFLYGVSLVYGATGSLSLEKIAEAAAATPKDPLLLMGVVLVTVALGFKIAAVPFHMYIPDAYEGAPTAITAFMATASKAAAFAVVLRVFVHGFGPLSTSWVPLFVLMSAASMTLGNVAAILQENTKRMLAYSSISHAGYALMGVIAAGKGVESGDYGMTAVALYLLVYSFTTLGAFGLVVLLRRERLIGDLVVDFAGLSRRAPFLAFAMLVFMLSLAGIPLTAGFVGKWYLFGAAIKAHYVWLAVLAVINSAVSLYYYVRIVVQMYIKDPLTEEKFALSPALVAALSVAVFFTLLIGVYPDRFVTYARMALIG
ncbi:MAG TPA: NADH-quinone oxidoreductase subunit N [Verrucomicrobiae bacterium]|nr:NADH-quinone oxidoreductase subunit N [Verrucomicrobiae bacterium]